MTIFILYYIRESIMTTNIFIIQENVFLVYKPMYNNNKYIVLYNTIYNDNIYSSLYKRVYNNNKYFSYT